MGTIKIISDTRFRGLSNFGPCIIPMIHKTGLLLFRTSEHYYQWHKCKNKKYKRMIYEASTPALAKFISSKNEMSKYGFSLIKGWDKKLKLEVMKDALYFKYHVNNNPPLVGLLLSTKNNKIVEDAPWDAYWGTGKDGLGQNNMGKLLENRRDYLLDTLSKKEIKHFISLIQ